MSDAVLNVFRDHAEAMGIRDEGWCWVGEHLSQRMFGISEQRAKEYAARHGGRAMLDSEYMKECEESLARVRARMAEK